MRLDIPIELMPEQALCILCKTLHMEFVYERKILIFILKKIRKLVKMQFGLMIEFMTIVVIYLLL